MRQGVVEVELLAEVAPGMPEEFGNLVALAVEEERKRQQITVQIHEMEACMPAPWRWVQRFNHMRSELLGRRLMIAARAFCTGCRKIFQTNAIQPMFLSGSRGERLNPQAVNIVRTCSYTELHRLCNNCQQTAPQPRRSIHLPDGRNAELFCLAWPARERDGAWQYKQSGGWRSVPETTSPIPKVTASHLSMPSNEVIAIERDWRLPPELFYKSRVGVYICNELGRIVTVG